MAFRPVDCHAHVMRRDLPLVAERHSAPARDVSVDEYLDVLDRHGIAFGVLTAPSFYGTDNSLLLSALDASRGRLRGTAIVDPAIPVDELQRLWQRGIRGIRLNWIRRKTIPDASSQEWRALFRKARQVGMHIEVFIESPRLPGVLSPILEEGAHAVLDHFACPDPARKLHCPGMQLVVAALAERRATVKLSAPYRLGGVEPREYVDAFMTAGGPRQLVWASDWPFVSHEQETSYADCVEALSRWIPDPAARSEILCETPARLFGFAPDAAPESPSQGGEPR